ncbi:MAG TPA: tetratricopeptide repeat protein [Candidatus Bathyarchaeia archaeon]|nr:tetratricopeptide repeat protein [Candidatus Bathyarchaeia archaeon]
MTGIYRWILCSGTPHDVDALNNKGVTLNSLGNYTGAILYYDKALAIDPNLPYVCSHKGTIL